MSYFKDRCKGVEPSDPEPFCLKWLKDSRVTTCYRCGNNIRQTTDDPVSPDPCDVAVCRKQAYVREACIAMKCSIQFLTRLR